MQCGFVHPKDKELETPDVDDEVKDLKLKYVEMARLMAQGGGGDRSIMDNLMQNTSLPFTDRVMKFPLPEKFKVPHIDIYDVEGNPTDHTENFRAHLILRGTPDEIAFRAFPLTLKGRAREWLRDRQKATSNPLGAGHKSCLLLALPRCSSCRKTKRLGHVFPNITQL